MLYREGTKRIVDKVRSNIWLAVFVNFLLTSLAVILMLYSLSDYGKINDAPSAGMWIASLIAPGLSAIFITVSLKKNYFLHGFLVYLFSLVGSVILTANFGFLYADIFLFISYFISTLLGMLLGVIGNKFIKAYKEA